MTVPMDRLGSRNGKAYLEVVLTLPPTDNNIYFNVTIKGKGGFKQHVRKMTDEAKAYQRSAAFAIAELALLNQVEFKKDVPYLFFAKVFFEDIVNKGWATGKAESRYKKVDTSNRSKLLTDSIMAAIGVDDSHIHPVIKFKRADSDDPRVEVKIYELDDDELLSIEEEVEAAVERVLWG